MKLNRATASLGGLAVGFSLAACTVTSSDDAPDEGASGSGGADTGAESAGASGASDDGSSGASDAGSGGASGSGGSDAGSSGASDAGSSGASDASDAGAAGDGDAGSTSAGGGGEAGGDSGSDGGASGSGGDSGSDGGASGSAGADAGTGGADSAPASIACDTRDTTDADEVSGAIADDETWSGTVYVTDNVDVRGSAVLTIAPGTNIIMAVDTDIEVGWNGGASALIADGTEEAPIRFCGEGSDAGYWKNIVVRDNVTSNSVLRHVLVSDGGGGDNAVRLVADITVDDLQVANSGSAGISAEDFRDGSSGLTVTDSMGAAVVLTGQGAATRFPLGGEFSDNEDNVVHVDFSAITESTTFHDVGIPYVQDDNVDVRETLDLTFEAGVEYRFTADTSLEVGWNGSDPTLLVDGTESQPVVFRGVAEDRGFWDGVLIRSNVRSNSRLSYLELMHAGAGTPALDIAAPVTLDHVTLDQNGTGVSIDEQGLSTESEDLTITGTAGVPLTVEPDALVTLPEGGTFTGNDDDRIAVAQGTYRETGVVPNLGVPYWVLGDIDTRDSSMTLTAGTEFLMSADSSLEFGWNGNEATIVAVGTADDPIRFTGTDETPGFWEGLFVRSNVLSASQFEYVEIGHAGGATTTGAALRLDTPTDVENCTFFESAGYGILAEDTDTNDYESLNTFEDTPAGSVGTL